MNIEFVGRHLHVGDKLRGFTTERLAKIERFLDEPVDVRVTIGTNNRDHTASIHVAHLHGQIEATEETETMHDAIGLALDKIEKQARRSRKKFQDTRRRADRASHAQVAQAWPVEVLEGPAANGGTEPKVIRSSQLHIKPMTIEEAILELRSSKNDFFVFREVRQDRVNVLYNRKDGNYGLITPEV